jgi:hypothetical protein
MADQWVFRSGDHASKARVPLAMLQVITCETQNYAYDIHSEYCYSIATTCYFMCHKLTVISYLALQVCCARTTLDASALCVYSSNFIIMFQQLHYYVSA